MANGFFGNIFDFDKDGKLDTFERAADTYAFCRLMEETGDVDDDDAFLYEEEFEEDPEDDGLDLDEK